MRYQGIGSLALRTYPPSIRAARGEEMLGTLLDAGDDSTGAFIRGCASLVIGGLRERARENVRIGAGRLIADAFCLAAVLCSLTKVLSWHPVPPGYGEASSLSALVLLAGVLVFALVGRDRLGGMCGVAAAAITLINASTVEHAVPSQYFVDSWLVPLVCFAVMAFKPRIRSHNPRKLLWLIPGTVVFAAFLIPHIAGPGVTGDDLLFRIPQLVAGVLVLFGLPLIGIFMLPIDPRLAIASAVFWAIISAPLALGSGLVTLPAVLLAVLLTVARQRAGTQGMRA